MPNTYSQIFTQYVFAVKGRQNYISENMREPLQQYMCGVVKEKKCRLLAIYCNPDHCHLFVGNNPNISHSDLLKTVKGNSSKWINEGRFPLSDFRWQKGFGAFSYSKSQVPKVVAYVLNQKEHHAKTSFKDEYIEFLEKFGVDYDERYLFEFYD